MRYMEKRALGRSGVQVGVLALGTMNWGSDWMGTGAVDEKTARGLLDYALADRFEPAVPPPRIENWAYS